MLKYSEEIRYKPLPEFVHLTDEINGDSEYQEEIRKFLKDGGRVKKITVSMRAQEMYWGSDDYTGGLNESYRGL